MAGRVEMTGQELKYPKMGRYQIMSGLLLSG